MPNLQSISNELNRLEQTQQQENKPPWIVVNWDQSVQPEPGTLVINWPDDIPAGTKVYVGISPDDWDEDDNLEQN